MQDLRIEKIRDILDELKLDAFYVTHIPNIRYLTGFSGSSATVLISRKKNYSASPFARVRRLKAKASDCAWSKRLSTDSTEMSG
jgi:Xaa-Pro aminopeptidase